MKDNKQNLWQGRSRRSCQQSHWRRNNVQRDSREDGGACQHLLAKSHNAYLNFWFFSAGDPHRVEDVVNVCSGLSRQRLDAISAAADKQVHWTNVRIVLMFSFCLLANHHCEVYTWQATNLGNDVTTLAIYYNLKSEHIIIHYKRCSADAEVRQEWASFNRT